MALTGIAQRLAFVRRCIVDGEQVWHSVSPSAANARAKLKVRICPGKAKTSMIARKMLLAVLDGVALVVQDSVSVHRGHRHSSGMSEFALWVSSAGGAGSE